MKNGYAYFPQSRTNLPNGEQLILSPTALVKVINGKTFVGVNNPTDQTPLTFGCTYHINMTPVNEFEELQHGMH